MKRILVAMSLTLALLVSFTACAGSFRDHRCQ